eukprot:2008700-Amphidinium_carterae.1
MPSPSQKADGGGHAIKFYGIKNGFVVTLSLKLKVLVGTVSLCSWAEDMQREASQKGPLWTEVSKVV